MARRWHMLQKRHLSPHLPFLTLTWGLLQPLNKLFLNNSSMAGQPADGRLVEMKPHPVLFNRCLTRENIQQISILKPSTHTE